ncbi:aromatic acid exporter family protein [Streptococcus catagoni]|uniref:aromatic acid exporter family protein n=1 Tax=Streptococcus catagoni TaxID=2654874 RepID=UPI00140D3FAA|nr:aromatic acid exporter family protein [Streptococcus catagoni]
MNLFERTLKMVLATGLSILLAQWLNLSYANSAGIIALLSVLDTRQSSLSIAKKRLISFLISFAIAVCIFYFCGYGLKAFILYLLLAIPSLYYLKIESGLVPITVLVSHLMQSRSLSIASLENEFLLFIIGTGLALLFNIYMGTNSKKIQLQHQIIENDMKAILFQLENAILNKSHAPLEKMVEDLDKQLLLALDLVYRDSNNQLFQQTSDQVHYFEMRRNQNRLLKDMVKTSRHINGNCREGILLSHLIHETAKQLSETNSALTLISDINDLLETYRHGNLPQTREEFENRALLFKILQDLDYFIKEKTTFYQNYKSQK